VRKALSVALCVVGLGGVINWVVYVDRHLPWQRDEAIAFQMARDENKGVMVDFWATWCTGCRELEKLTFAKSPIYETITENFVPLQFDMTMQTDADAALLKKYAAGTPTVIFFTADGREIGRVLEYQSPSKFMKTLAPAVEAVRAQRDAAAQAAHNP